MPRRSTPYQAIVHLVRKQTAAPGVTVTESKELYDEVLRTTREVDIVVEGTFDGDPVVTSIEVIEHGRVADLPWVEQQIGKHRHLPTNRLILVSKSGFTKNALVAVGVEGGWVDAVQPTLVEVDGETIIETLYADMIQLTPTACGLEVVHPHDGQPLDVQAVPDLVVYAGDGMKLGTALQLSYEALGISWILKKYSQEAHNHPERDDLKYFILDLPIEGLGYCLRSDEDDSLHVIRVLHLKGQFGFSQWEMPFTETELAGRRFGAGQGPLLGLPGVWVRTTDPETNSSTITWQITDDPARPVLRPPDWEPRFPGLKELEEPTEWSPEPGGWPRQHGPADPPAESCPSP